MKRFTGVIALATALLVTASIVGPSSAQAFVDPVPTRHMTSLPPANGSHPGTVQVGTGVSTIDKVIVAGPPGWNYGCTGWTDPQQSILGPNGQRWGYGIALGVVNGFPAIKTQFHTDCLGVPPLEGVIVRWDVDTEYWDSAHNISQFATQLGGNWYAEVYGGAFVNGSSMHGENDLACHIITGTHTFYSNYKMAIVDSSNSGGIDPPYGQSPRSTGVATLHCGVAQDANGNWY